MTTRIAPQGQRVKLDQVEKQSQGRWIQRLLWVVVFAGLAISASPSALMAQTESDQPGSIWGKIDHYSHDYAIVDGKRYEFSKTTTIDTRSLMPDQRGNVRVVLDGQRRVAKLYFYGVDMPDVIKQFRR